MPRTSHQLQKQQSQRSPLVISTKRRGSSSIQLKLCFLFSVLCSFPERLWEKNSRNVVIRFVQAGQVHISNKWQIVYHKIIFCVFCTARKVSFEDLLPQVGIKPARREKAQVNWHKPPNREFTSDETYVFVRVAARKKAEKEAKQKMENEVMTLALKEFRKAQRKK